MHRFLIEAIKVYTPFKLKFDFLLPVWCKFHVDGLFRSEDIEKEKGVLFSWLLCHVIYGKSGKPDFYF